MQNQYSQHPGCSQPAQGYGNTQYHNQQYGNNQQYPQNQYYYPNYRQAPQYPKIQVTQNGGYYAPAYRQAVPHYSHQQGNTQQTYRQPGVVPAYVQPQIGYQGHKRDTSQYAAPVLDYRQRQQQKRFRNVLMDESVADYDDLKRKRKVHAMDIIAPILALCILGAGFLAIYKPFNRLSPGYSIPQTEEVPPLDKVVESASLVSSAETEIAPDDHPDAATQSYRNTSRERRRTAYRAPGRSAFRTAGLGSDRIVITSIPSGALVKANGNLIGRTPYTWHNPDVYGQIELKAKKKGYGVERTTVEFTGGTVENHFVLTKISPETQQPAPVQTVQNTPPVQQPVVQNRQPVLRQTVVNPQQVAFAANQGTIYLSTIPPNAEVYVNGKMVGTSNSDLAVPAGSHMVKFVKGDKTSTRRMTFTAGKNPSQLVRLK